MVNSRSHQKRFVFYVSHTYLIITIHSVHSTAFVSARVVVDGGFTSEPFIPSTSAVGFFLLNVSLNIKTAFKAASLTSSAGFGDLPFL